MYRCSIINGLYTFAFIRYAKENDRGKRERRRERERKKGIRRDIEREGEIREREREVKGIETREVIRMERSKG